MNTDTTIEFRRCSEGYAAVYIDDKRLSPARSLKLRRHSPTGFEWGYGGSGPAQLALALMLEAGLTDEEATRLYQPFKFQVIAGLDDGDTLAGADVLGWAERASGLSQQELWDIRSVA